MLFITALLRLLMGIAIGPANAMYLFATESLDDPMTAPYARALGLVQTVNEAGAVAFILRTVAPGLEQPLPHFQFESCGVLTTNVTLGGHPSPIAYNSQNMGYGNSDALIFGQPSSNSDSHLTLEHGFVTAPQEVPIGWMLCGLTEGEWVVYYRNFDVSCRQVHLYLSKAPPSTTTLSRRTAMTVAAPTPNPTGEFYLITTSSSYKFDDPSLAPNVSAIDLSDALYPREGQAYNFRLIGPGVDHDIPTFHMEGGSIAITTWGPVPDGIDTIPFYSQKMSPGDLLTLYPKPANGKESHLIVEGGYLVLTPHGDPDGWTVCTDDKGEKVIYYKGTDSSCVPRYLQLAATPPYR